MRLKYALRKRSPYQMAVCQTLVLTCSCSYWKESVDTIFGNYADPVVDGRAPQESERPSETSYLQTMWRSLNYHHKHARTTLTVILSKAPWHPPPHWQMFGLITNLIPVAIFRYAACVVCTFEKSIYAAKLHIFTISRIRKYLKCLTFRWSWGLNEFWCALRPAI